MATGEDGASAAPLDVAAEPMVRIHSPRPFVQSLTGAQHHISFHDFLKTCSRGALRNAEMILRKYPHYINVFDCVLTHPLHVAAANGHIGLCGFLLAKGADPLARDIDGNTALHFAARNGRCETIEQLVQLKTIEVDIGNNVGASPPPPVALDRAPVGACGGH